jgi:alcohol dehydrogenase class IV
MNVLPKELILPPRTLFRKGAVLELLRECRAFGKRGVLVHGRSLAGKGVLQSISKSSPDDVELKCWQHTGGEPTLGQLEDLLSFARQHRTDWIAGVGGGSVIDLAKACAGLVDSSLPVAAYHDGAPLVPSRIPFLAVPTTAGTGSEATIVCVLTNSKTGVKKSFRHPSLMARLVILDPDLLAGSPKQVIAHSGMDAFTQAVESYVSTGASWFTDQLCLKALSLISSSIEAVFKDPGDPRAADLLMGSYLAGLALSNARLGIVHGLAHPLGARYHVAHGLACAACLPDAIEFNREAMGEKYGRIGEAIGGDLLQETGKLNRVLVIHSPFPGRDLKDVDKIIEETLASGSTAANPRKVTAVDVERLLKKLFR